MKILISAGPTQEPIDSVRFITNASSGRMGLALAEAAVREGHRVVVILGPVALRPKIKGVRIVEVRTADEMAKAVLRELKKGFDVFISAAAVGDYTPEKTFSRKISSSGTLVLRLKPTKKITSLVKKRFPRVFVVAFKAEFNVSRKTLVDRAFLKLSREKLDLIVANDIGKNRMGCLKTDAYIIDGRGKVYYVKTGNKSVVAREVMKVITSLLLGKAFS